MPPPLLGGAKGAAVFRSLATLALRRQAPLRGGLAHARLREELAEPGLVDDLGAELLGLRELRAGAVAGHQVVGVLRDGSRHLAAGAADQPRRLVAGHLGKGARE